MGRKKLDFYDPCSFGFHTSSLKSDLKKKKFPVLADFHRAKAGSSWGSTSWGRKVSHPAVDVAICNAHLVSSMWHHLVLPWLHHCWCREWEGDCSQTTIPEESCQHSQNVFMSVNSINFNESLARIVWAKGWGSKRSWQSDESEVGFILAFLLPHTWKIQQCNYSYTVLWTSLVLCAENPKSGLSSGRCPCGGIKHS